VALAVLRLVDISAVHLTDRLKDRWPKLKCTEKDSPTVEQVLGHLAGMWSVLPPSTMELKDLLDPEAMLSAWEASPSSEPAGASQRYHHTSFGFLCAGICRHLGRKELPELWQEVADATACHSCCGISTDELRLTISRDICEEQGLAVPCQTFSSAGLGEISNMVSKVGEYLEEGEVSPSAQAARDVFGREHLVDQSLYTRTHDVAATMLPGLQAFGTARAVASLVSAVKRGKIISPGMVDELRQSRRPSHDDGSAGRELNEHLQHLFKLDSFEEWGLGAQLVRPEVWGGKAESTLPWGHLTQNGSMVLHVPGPQPVVVALLLNMVNHESTHRVAWAVMRVIEEHVKDGR